MLKELEEQGLIEILKLQKRSGKGKRRWDEEKEEKKEEEVMEEHPCKKTHL